MRCESVRSIEPRKPGSITLVSGKLADPGTHTSRLGCFEAMCVWDAESSGEIVFDASELGTDELGHIVENANLVQALADEAKAWPSLIGCAGIE